MSAATSREPARPRQLRLPGQAAAPEGPVDMTMMYLMHHAFRRDLDAFAAAVRHTPVADRRTWRRLADRWELFGEALHEHHTVEDDAIWPALLGLCEPQDAVVLQAMEAEHGELDPLLQSCGAGFDRLRAHADEDARAALAVRVAAARECLRRHLHHEETEAIALIQRLVTAEQWAAIEAGVGHRTSLGQAVRLVPWVAAGVPGDVRRRVLAEGPAAFRVLERVTRGRWARQEARTFRHGQP